MTINFNEANFVINTNGGAVQTGDREQVVSITDMLCEGPVQGLVDNSASSVYLDDIPAESATFAGVYNNGVSSSVQGTIAFNGSSTAGAVTDGPIVPTADSSALLRQLVLTNYLETANFGTVSVGTFNPSTNTTNITFTSVGSENFTTEWLTTGESAKRAILYTENNSYEGQIVGIGSGVLSVDLYGDTQDIGLDPSIETYKVRVKLTITVASNTTTSITTSGFVPASGFYNFIFTEALAVSRVNPLSARGYIPRTDDFQLQFRDGSLNQNPISEVGRIEGGASTAYTPSGTLELKQLNPSYVSNNANVRFSLIDSLSTSYPESTSDYSAAPFFLQGSNINADTGVSPGQMDEVVIRIAYPSGLLTTNLEKGAKEQAYAFYRFEIDVFDENGISLNGGEFVNCFPNYGPYIIHKGKTSSPVTFEHVISLDQFRPFADFRIRISRLTRHAGLPVTADGTAGGRTDNDKWLLSATAQVSGVQVVSKDKLSYPFTSIANVNFSTQRYQNTPKRSYLMQGLKVRIPSNYIPRESSSNGEAKYDGFWDGQFKEGLHYTDNPAWVFYDLVVNNRYGAGEWISREDIDVYSLYRVAKYCDELVPSGKTDELGQPILEPRFRANVYLTKATDVYKILKDMASIFTGMLYWMDSQLTLVQDVPQDPIANFSQANVIEGRFSYESTGLKTRANQIIVTWNDPARNYEPTPLIVEDREDIVRKGRIISEEAVAFGATSEGQAIRYGRWKLWTAQNQTESVSFSTGLQGAYVRPGDVINVQDNSRYDTALSGRIKSVSLGTSDVTVDLDRATSLNAGDQVAFSFLVSKPTAIYTGESDFTFTRGMPITEAVYIAAPGNTTLFKIIETEQEAANAYKDPGLTNPIQNIWKKHTYVHTTTGVTEGVSGSSSVVLTDSDTFDLVQTLNLDNLKGTIWAMKAASESVDFVGDVKAYRVLAIAQNEKHQYDITAVEYYEEKYDAVDKDYVLGVIPSSEFLPEDVTQNIPAPANIYVISETDPIKVGEEITVQWDAVDENYVAGYELHHNIPGVQSPIRTASTSAYFERLPNGLFTFRVRAVSSAGNVSDYTSIEYTSIDPFETNVPRVQEGIPSGLVANCTAYYNSSGNRIVFEKLPYVLASIGDPENAVSVSQVKNYVPLAHIPYYSAPSETNREYSIFYISSGPFVQQYASSSDYHLLGYYDTKTIKDLPHWRFLEPGVQHDQSPSSDFNWWRVRNTSGTTAQVSVAAGSNRLIGTNTNFLNDSLFQSLSVRDIVQFSGDNLAHDAGVLGAKVIAVVSPTEVLLDRTFDTPITNQPLYRRNIRPDFVRDAMWGTVQRFSDTPDTANFIFTKNIRVDSELMGNGAVVLDCSVSFLNYSTDGTPVGHPSTITATATAIGYLKPIFRIIAPAPLTGDGEDFFAANQNSNEYVKDIFTGTDIPFGNGDPIEFSVEVTESADPDNPANIRTATFEIGKVSEAAAGRDAKSVKLTSEDYTIVYDQYGGNPQYSTAVQNGNISLTATGALFENATLFRFTTALGTGDWGSNGTNSLSFDLEVPTDISQWVNRFGESPPNATIIVEAAELPDGWDQGSQTPTPVVSATDSISLKALIAGQDGLTVSLSNETHVLPLLVDGTIVNTGSGTTIEVLRGGTPLTFVATGNVPGPDEWTIGSTSTTDDPAITVGGFSGAGGTIATVSDHVFTSGVEPTEQITYNILVGDPSGGSTSIERKQSFSLSAPAQDGIDGTSSAIVYLYKASATVPEPPQNVAGFPDIQVDMATGTITGFPTSGTDGWIADLSAGTLGNGEVWWLVAATASTSSTLDNITPGEWTDPPIQFSGWNGISTTIVELFKVTNSAIQPDPPSGTLSVTFSGPTLISGGNITTSWNGTSDDEWSAEPPSLDANNDYLWRITAAALAVAGNSGSGTVDEITTDDWSTPSISGVYVEGQPGEPGSGTAVVYLYKVSNEGATVSDPNTDTSFPNDITVDLTTGKITGYTPYDEWVTEPPSPARNEIVWIISASANGSEATDTIERLEWSTPSIFSGFDGENGLNSGFIALYQATSTDTPPDDPIGNFDFNFTNSVLTPEFASNFNGWVDLDAIGDLSPVNAYIWMITAAPSASTSETTITGSDFSSPRLIANYAADGEPGSSGLKTATFFIYYNTSSASSDGIPSPSAISFDFSTFSFLGLTPGWSLSAPEFVPANGQKYWYSTVTVLEDAPAGSDEATGSNISFGSIQSTIGFSGLVTFQGGSITDGEGGEFNYTAIFGNEITTGVIKSNDYTEGADLHFSDKGTKIDLNGAGSIRAKNFAIASNGDAFYRGSINLSQITDAGALASEDTVDASTQVSGLGNLALQNTVNASTQVLGLGALALQNTVNASTQVTGLLTSATSNTAFNSAASAAAPVQDVRINGISQGSVANITPSSLNFSSTDIADAGGITGISGDGITVIGSTASFDATSLQISTAQLSGDFVESVNGVSGPVTGVVSSNTSITAGKIELSSGSLDFTTGATSNNNSIVLDTTSGNNSIVIYDRGTPRVRLGKLYL